MKNIKKLLKKFNYFFPQTLLIKIFPKSMLKGIS